MSSLKGRDFLSLADYSAEELLFIMDTAKLLKERFYCGEKVIPVLTGRTLAMIFEKPSTRTRVSFEVAMKQLGGHAIYLSWRELQLARGETIGDTARTLARYVDGIVARVYEHEKLEELAKHSDKPVINGLSNLLHPVQALSDMFTIMEKKGDLRKLKIVFVGDGGSNVAHSLLLGLAILGGGMTIACPKGYEPVKQIMDLHTEISRRTGGYVEITNDPVEAVKGADVVYTDVWVSMGMEAEAEKRLKDFVGFSVNSKLMSYAKPDAVFMHCLPAHRGMEVTDEVIDGPWSIVWDQAENRLHLQKAILSLIIP